MQNKRRRVEVKSAPPSYPCQKCGGVSKRVLYFELEEGKTTEYKLCPTCAGMIEIEINKAWQPLVSKIVQKFFEKV